MDVTTIRWRAGTVRALGHTWRGAREVTVEVERRSDDEPAHLPALAYPPLVGEPAVGDRVLLNTAALDLGLGTGGYAFVVAMPDRLPPDAAAAVDRPDGHVVKARYTPLQAIVAGVDEQSSPHHTTLADADDIGGMPVITADLHSALPAVVAGVHVDAPWASVAYVMTDGGALPAWFSRTAAALADRLAGIVTVGQAYGGDLEAVTLHTGLLAAKLVLGADITVVTQGPGNLGTGTRFGFSGVAVGEAVNATAVLGGRPVGALRLSTADPRPRHHGVSHHSLTAYGRVALAGADLVVPGGLPHDLRAQVTAALDTLPPRHRIVTVDTAGLEEALRASPAPLSSMGRGLDADRTYFVASAAAGRFAASLLVP
jgi:hypothetical protein